MKTDMADFWANRKKREELASLLENVINIYSPSGDAASVTKVGDIFAREYSNLGFTVKRIPQGEYGSHLVAELKGTESGPCVLLMGHMDTVESSHPQDRKFDLKGDIARGLGVLDMKGGLVTMLYGVQSFLEAYGPDFPGTIRVFYNADEEVGSPASRPLLPSVLKGVTAALVAEPAKPDGAVKFVRKGCGIFRIRVRGRASHAGSAPDEGRSAIRELMEKLIAMENLKGGGTTINTGVIHGGMSPWIVPEEAFAAIDVRVPTVEERRRIEKELEAIRRKNWVPDTETVIEGEFHRPPIALIPGSRELMEILRKNAEAIQAPVSFPEDPEGAVGDINNIVDSGIPGVDGIGPLGSGAHSEDEYILFSSLYDRGHLTSLTLKSLLDGDLTKTPATSGTPKS